MNTRFEISPSDEERLAEVTPLVSGSGQTGETLTTNGWTVPRGIDYDVDSENEDGK